MAKRLKKKVAVVTGATRGIGLGIARGLGEEGATVVVAGRSTSVERNKEKLPGTVESAAAAVKKAGGKGYWFSCDLTKEAEAVALAARVREKYGRLDILVNAAWGGYEKYDLTGFSAPFWEQPLEYWERMFERGVRMTYRTTRCLAPLLMDTGGGLIVNVSAGDRGLYLRNMLYDAAKGAIDRLTFGMAEELRDHDIAAISLYPGFTRTERVLAVYDGPLEVTESPIYAGRSVAALAADKHIIEKSGLSFKTGELAIEYGFKDEDGRQPAPFMIDGGPGE